MHVRPIAWAALALLLPFTFGARTLADAVAPRLDADVLIQAGHEGRPDCDREPATLCNSLGARGEIDWTPIVADETTRVLRAAGLTVLRERANLQDVDVRVRDAVFIHFDGNEKACSSAASIGFPDAANGWQTPANSATAAAEWRDLYGRFIPFGFEPDNFTSGLRKYYGFRHVTVGDAALVIEGGEITCPQQRAWLQNRLVWEGDLIAYFLSRRTGLGNVAMPAFVR